MERRENESWQEFHERLLDAADVAMDVERADRLIDKPPTLDQIALRHGTDKSSAFHSYAERYEQYLGPLRHKPITFLEIGIAAGASLRTWADYFTNPMSAIIGVDHNPEFVKVFLSDSRYFGKRVFAIQGEATDPEFWAAIPAVAPLGINVICDDGGHHSSQIIKTFDLAFPLIAAGGIYCVEDLHASYDEAHNRDGGKTAMEFFHHLTHIVNEMGVGQCGKPSDQAMIDWIHFSKSLVIIKKR